MTSIVLGGSENSAVYYPKLYYIIMVEMQDRAGLNFFERFLAQETL